MLFFKKKEKAQTAEPMDLDAVMKKYDRESNTRVWEGTPKLIVNIFLALFSLFCMYFFHGGHLNHYLSMVNLSFVHISLKTEM